MPWTPKEIPTPFDHEPISGLYFYIGDVIATIREPDLPDHWADDLRGLKYPQVEFPSGIIADIVEGTTGFLVCLLREMRLPFTDTRDAAYLRVLSLLEPQQKVVKVGESGLAI